jgi:hypothetical protein
MVIFSRKNTGRAIKSKQAQCRERKDIIESAHLMKISQYCRYEQQKFNKF